VCFAFGGVGSLGRFSLSLSVPLPVERKKEAFSSGGGVPIFLIIFRGKQKNNAKHSLAAIEKKNNTAFVSLNFFYRIIFNQLFNISLEIRNSKNAKPCFFGKNETKLFICYLSTKRWNPPKPEK